MFKFLFKAKPQPGSDAHEPIAPASVTDEEEIIFKLKAAAAPTIAEIDLNFMGMLMGINSLLDEDLKSSEKKTLDNIRNWVRQDTLPDNLVPRLPAVIPKIMLAVRDENSTAQDIANLITEDVSLVGEVIRLSNSAYYRTGEKIESLKQAIVKLGLNGIRQLISSAAFKPILNPGQGNLSRDLGKHLWDKNQRAAMAGNFLAMHTGDDRFHAYLTGLMQQVGLLVIVKQLEQSFGVPDFPRSRSFMSQLDSLSQMITLKVGKQWQMPQAVIQALEDQPNDKTPAQISSPGQVAYIADRLAKMSILETAGQLLDTDEGLHSRVGKINSRLCNQCYTLINLDREKQAR